MPGAFGGVIRQVNNDLSDPGTGGVPLSGAVTTRRSGGRPCRRELTNANFIVKMLEHSIPLNPKCINLPRLLGPGEGQRYENKII